jgi:coenzyme F420-reducing hydrogenase gamma subunit
MLQINYLVDIEFFYSQMDKSTQDNADITLVHGTHRSPEQEMIEV